MRYSITIQKHIWADSDEEAFNQVKEIENEKDDNCKVLSLVESPKGSLNQREIKI